MNPAQQLAGGIGELGLVIPQEVQKRLLAYLHLIVKWNRIHNLTAIRDIPAMVSAHLLDSLAVVPYLSAQSILDIGSGAGLPGIPLALAWPQSKVTLLDSNQKKAIFLRQASIELGLQNVVVVCERVESWQTQTPFDLVISRAFSDMADFFQVAARLCRAGGTLAAMKGVYPREELGRLPAGCVVRKILPLHVPGLHAERHLVLIEP
jgi:16S rRNA (guanine527-N7)-methyltransferase